MLDKLSGIAYIRNKETKLTTLLNSGGAVIKVFLVFLFIFLFAAPLFAQVDTAWVRRYDGPGNSNDIAYAVAVDGSGNVYVTGYSIGSGTGSDFATVKYDSDGDALWVKRYNGPGNSSDAAVAIAVDGSGNVYVTGWSYGSGTGKDYAIIKYESDGDTAWIRRYDGPANSVDEPTAIAVDGSGNVYVTGLSEPSGSYDYDYVTIKYDSDGDTAWLRSYNGPADHRDMANALAIDGSGYVYVTGESYAIGTDDDYATIKYEPDGDTAWVRRYDGPYSGAATSLDRANAIAVDGSGYVYVTGGSRGAGTANLDYATIKYDSDGDMVWLSRYDGVGGYWDEAYDIGLDGYGNVYVTGSSAENSSFPPVYDYVTIAYKSDGDQSWLDSYDGPGEGNDEGRAIAVHDSGLVWVTGKSYDSDYDYATIKYGPDGNRRWVERYDGPVNGNDDAHAIVADDSENAYVTGGSSGSGSGYDYATIKYIRVSVCGDVNGDEKVDVGDMVYLLNYLYQGGPPPPDPWTADLNGCDGIINVGDVVYLRNYLYSGGDPPDCCD